MLINSVTVQSHFIEDIMIWANIKNYKYWLATEMKSNSQKIFTNKY